jgi:simple sugar transport system permease protein
MMHILFSTSTFSATIRMSAPIIFAAIGSAYGHKAKIFNIGLESYVLTSAFFATWGSYLFENPFMGLLLGIISGLAMSFIFGVSVLYLKADPIVVGIAMNLSAWGLTSLLLFNIFHIRGSIMHPRIKSFSKIDIPLLRQIPILGDIFNNHDILVYVAIFVVILSQIAMYKTPFGLRLRGVGINENAVQSTGVSVMKYKWISLILTGVLAGMAGTSLPLNGISMFTENMSAGKGFLGVSAARIGKGDPIKTFFACLVFAYADAISVGLQSFNIPSQLVLMTPYIVTIAVMCLTNINQLKKKTV